MSCLRGLASLAARDILGPRGWDEYWIAKESDSIPEGLSQWPRTVYALRALEARGLVVQGPRGLWELTEAGYDRARAGT